MNGIVFFDRCSIGSSEKRRGGTENKTRNLVRQDNFQKRERVRGVVTKVLLRKFHRLASFDGSGHVNHAVELVFLKDAVKCRAIAGVAFYEFSALGHGGFVAVAEIVVYNDVVATLQEFRGNDAADISGASGDEYAVGHGEESPSEAEWLRRSSSKMKPGDRIERSKRQRARLHQESGGYASQTPPP